MKGTKGTGVGVGYIQGGWGRVGKQRCQAKKQQR